MASNKKGAKSAPSVTTPTKYVDDSDNPGALNNMFGSLFGVAVTRPEIKQRLTRNWYRIIRRWYPNFHRQVYCCPPIHFNAVAYAPTEQGFTEKLREQYGVCTYRPVKYSAIKNDESQQRILQTFKAFAERKGQVCFILSNMEFQNYLSKNYDWADPQHAQNMPRPDITLKNEEGEIDVLIIDKDHGVVVLEIKAVGDEEKIWDGYQPTEEKKIGELHDKFKKSVGVQVQKGKCVIRKLLSDLQPTINIRGGIALTNVKRSFYKKALENYDKQRLPELLKQMDVDDIESLSKITFCCEDLPEKYTPGEEPLMEEVFRGIDQVWNNLMAMDGGGASQPMSQDLYEQTVARFCGPLTTVKIYTEKTYPRVKLEIITKGKSGKRGPVRVKEKLIPEEAPTKAVAARIMARRFSELVLLEEQIELLQRNEDFVHIEGPPGTGKTLLLLLRILSWLDEGHMVWVLSLSPPSRSVTHVLMQQVKKMVKMHKTEGEAEKVLKRLHMFMQIRPDHTLDDDYFKRHLLKFRKRAMRNPPTVAGNISQRLTQQSMAPSHDCKVCLALDETGMAGKGLTDFFKWVAALHKEKAFQGQEFKKGLSVWSASVERVGRPAYVTEPGSTDRDKFGIFWELKLPLRCPPSVQRALILVQPYLDLENICCFTEEMTLSHPAKQQGTQDREIYAADGLPVFLIAHGSHKHPETDIWFCYECGDELADYLQNVLHIGEEECDCEDKPVIYDDITEKNCPDCHKLTKGTLPAAGLPLKYNDVMIVATQRAFQFSVPIGKFALAMKKRNLKVAVNTTREEGQAPIPAEDIILIADITSVHGLERAIIVVIPEVNPPPPLPARYRGMLYPEPPYLPDSKEKKRGELSKEVEEALAEGERKGKGGIVMNTDGKTEEDDDDDEEGVDQSGPKTCDPSQPTEAEKKDSLDAPTSGEVAQDKGEPTTENQEAETRNGTTNDTEAPSRSSNPAPDQDSAAREISGTCTMDFPSTEEAEEGTDGNDSTTSAEGKLPYTYNDAFSKQEIEAALASLSSQSRQDVFYIGSRAVCQMIVVHLGKKTGPPSIRE